jgi:hypothetical protein
MTIDRYISNLPVRDAIGLLVQFRELSGEIVTAQITGIHRGIYQVATDYGIRMIPAHWLTWAEGTMEPMDFGTFPEVRLLPWPEGDTLIDLIKVNN